MFVVRFGWMVAGPVLGSPEGKAPAPGHTGASTQSLPADGCFVSGCQLALGTRRDI